VPARTPGSLGINDHADPNVTSLLGDTPGVLGHNDHADVGLPSPSSPAGAARLSDGTPVSPGSDGKLLEQGAGAFIDPDYADNTDSVGDGFCVPLVQLNTQVGRTTTWRAGPKLGAIPRPLLVAGTAIATFNRNNVYESHERGNHAAFFVKYDNQNGQEGIVIYDQYREWPDKLLKSIHKLEESEQGLKELTKTALGPDLKKTTQALDVVREQVKLTKKDMETSFPEVDSKGRRFKRKNPSERFIPFGHKGSPSNDASAFSVITH
jgi:hypothetical protein